MRGARTSCTVLGAMTITIAVVATAILPALIDAFVGRVATAFQYHAVEDDALDFHAMHAASIPSYRPAPVLFHTSGPVAHPHGRHAADGTRGSIR